MSRNRSHKLGPLRKERLRRRLFCVKGLTIVRQCVAEYFTNRDGVPADMEDIYMGSRASDLIKSVLTLFVGDVDGKRFSVMVPCPQYPLFSGALAALGLHRADYCLYERRAWALQLEELERSYNEASAGHSVRAIVVINLGNATGQMRPPAPGDESYKQYAEQVTAILQTLTEGTKTAYEIFNSFPGYSCNIIDASMFAYPCVDIPPRAQREAAHLNMSADEFFVLRPLEETGICVVPGTGFGQIPGTFHFRITILHSREEFHYMMTKIRKFHKNFLTKYL